MTTTAAKTRSSSRVDAHKEDTFMEARWFIHCSSSQRCEFKMIQISLSQCLSSDTTETHKPPAHLDDDALTPVLLLKAAGEEIHEGLHTLRQLDRRPVNGAENRCVGVKTISASDRKWLMWCTFVAE